MAVDTLGMKCVRPFLKIHYFLLIFNFIWLVTFAADFGSGTIFRGLMAVGTGAGVFTLCGLWVVILDIAYRIMAFLTVLRNCFGYFRCMALTAGLVIVRIIFMVMMAVCTCRTITAGRRFGVLYG